jgi:hypothetical protein
VVFKPQTVGTIQGTITFTDSAGTGTQTVSLTGSATKPHYKLSVNPGSMTLRAGEMGHASFVFEPLDGFKGSVTLTCAGLPANASCQFSPGSLTADGSGATQTADVEILTVGNSAAQMSTGVSGITFASLLGVNFLLLRLGRLRRKVSPGLKALVLSGLLAAGIGGISGCGSGILSVLAPAGTQAVGMTATTNGTQGADAQTASFTLTITR